MLKIKKLNLILILIFILNTNKGCDNNKNFFIITSIKIIANIILFAFLYQNNKKNQIEIFKESINSVLNKGKKNFNKTKKFIVNKLSHINYQPEYYIQC